MAETLKFTFNTAFGTRSENEELNVELPIITQEDVDAARTQGFIQGREDGLAEATGQFNADFKTSFETISEKLDVLLTSQAASAQMAMEQAQNYALLIAQKISKAALTQHPTEQIIALIDDCLSHVSLMPHLVVRVHQSLSQQTQTELQPIIEQKGFEGKLIILGEEDIPLGDCMIEWADGGVAHNTQQIVQIISNRLADYFGFDAEAVQAETQPELTDENTDLLDENHIENDDEDIFGSDEDETIDDADEVETTDEAEQDELVESLDEDAQDEDTLDKDTLNTIVQDEDTTDMIDTDFEPADEPSDQQLVAEPQGLEGQIDEWTKPTRGRTWPWPI